MLSGLLSIWRCTLNLSLIHDTPEIILELCDYCHWSLICFNRRGIIETCPDCNKNISQIHMNIDEVCSIKYDDRRGVTITFDRGLVIGLTN